MDEINPPRNINASGTSAAVRATIGVSATLGEDKKLASVNALCARIRWDFKPMGFESTGGVGLGTKAFLKTLIRRQALQLNLPVADVAVALYTRLSITIAKGCAGMLCKAFQGPSLG